MNANTFCKTVLLAGAVLAAAVPVFAQGIIQTPAMALREELRPYRSFITELHRTMPSGDVVVSKLWFKSPLKYRLELDDGSIITSDGKRRVIYEPDIDQAVYSDPAVDLEVLPLMVFGTSGQRDQYEVDILLREGGVSIYSFALPEKEVFLKLTLNAGVPDRIEWVDMLGNPLQIKIVNIQPKRVKSRMFRQRPPRGTEILHLQEGIL